MIASVEELFNREPLLAARILGYWSNAFSAAVSICFFKPATFLLHLPRHPHGGVGV